MLNKYLFTFFFTLSIIIPGCSSTDTVDVNSELKRHEPREILRFDQAGEHFFVIIGTESIVLKDGSFLLAELDNPKLIHISPDGEYVGTSAAEGRGPGEMIDITFMSNKPENGFLAYDQRNRKILVFDYNAIFISEFIIPQVDGSTLIAVYSLSEDRYLMIYSNLQQYYTGTSAHPILHQFIYDKENDTIINSVTLNDELRYRIFYDGVARGMARIPYGASPLRAYDAVNGLFYSFWSGGNEIAVLNQNLDTLRTVTVEIQTEALSSSERDSLRNLMSIERWRELEPLLPHHKALAREMHVDSNENIWLLLNHRSNANEWLILDSKGNPDFIVMLPKESDLTHVSDHHLGVRLDDGTFALFESLRESFPD